MPTADFRVQVGFFDHPKTELLIRKLGLEGPWSILQLWEFCAKTVGKSAGNLCKMDGDRIEIAAKWRGDPGVWFKAALEIGFIDRIKRCQICKSACYWVHDYKEINPWAANADSRRKNAQKAAKSRWEKTQTTVQEVHPKSASKSDENASKSLTGKRKKNGEVMRGALRIDATRNADPCDPQCSISNTNSNTKTNTKTDTNQPAACDDRSDFFTEEKSKNKNNGQLSARIQTVWGAYRQHHPATKATLGSRDKRYALIKRRLAEGYGVTQLVAAINGYHKSPWHLGDNDNGVTYLDLSLILRNDEKIEKGIDFDKNPPQNKRNGEKAIDWGQHGN